MSSDILQGFAWDTSPPGTSFNREGTTHTIVEDLGEKIRVRAQNNRPCSDPHCRECRAQTFEWPKIEWVLRFEADLFGAKVLQHISMPTWSTPLPRRDVGLNFKGPDGTLWSFNVVSEPVRPREASPHILVTAFLYDGEKHHTLLREGVEEKTSQEIAREIQPLLEGFVNP